MQTANTRLPQSMAAHVGRQTKQFENDFVQVRKFYECSRNDFLWAWLCVNTRCVYYDLPQHSPADCMTMAPYLDFLNHAADGCSVTQTADGLRVTAGCVYEAGVQVHLCYGRHSNEFLWCEYGFVMQDNPFDEITLDAIILPMLTTRKADLLRDIGFLG